MAGGVVKTGTVEKYLGDHLCNTTVMDSVDHMVEMRLRAVVNPIMEILALAEDMKSSYIGPVSVAKLLWESIIVKNVLNNSGSWVGISDKTMKKLEAVQTNFFKRLLT